MIHEMEVGTIDKFISREDTKWVKGIAIVLMLMHHLWTFPDRIAGGGLKYLFTIFDQSSIVYLGSFGKICVSLFFFIGGYGTYLGYVGKEYDLVGKLKKLYISYWKVFVIFIPIAFLLCSNQPAYCENSAIWSRFSSFLWQECWGNFVGMNTSYNGEWWFLSSYVFALISFPLLRAVIEKHPLHTNLFIIIIASILVTNFFPAIGSIETIGSLNNNFLYSRFICQVAPFVSSFWMGMAAAKDGVLDRLCHSLQEAKLSGPVIGVAAWCVVIVLRQSVIGDSADFAYIPVLLVMSKSLLQRLRFLERILARIGRQSTNMWLIHSFFCYYFYPVVRIVVAPRWAIPSLLVLIVLTYGASVGVTQFWMILGRIWNKEREKIHP